MRAAITEAELTSEERAAELVVRGFASRPEVQRGNRNGIYVFVNKRLVRDRLILHAIHEAYRNVLPPAVFPAVLLFLDLPAEEVDVNVHPAKIEVRFRHPQFVHDFTRDSIRQALSRARPIRGCASRRSPRRARERRRSHRRGCRHKPIEHGVAARCHSSLECASVRRIANERGKRHRRNGCRRFRIDRSAPAAGGAAFPVRKRHRDGFRRIAFRKRTEL
jgi:DNA mismatch repair ATPase MutL